MIVGGECVECGNLVWFTYTGGFSFRVRETKSAWRNRPIGLEHPLKYLPRGGT